MSIKNLLTSVIGLMFLSTAPILAVAPPGSGVRMPEEIIELQKRLSREYGNTGIAHRIQALRQLRLDALDNKVNAEPATLSVSVPVLLGSYLDNANIFVPSDFETLLFGANPTGSMRDYYLEVSYGQLDVTGTVYGPFVANGYQSDFNAWYAFPDNPTGFVYELLIHADSTVDFSAYDNDGPDGVPNSGDDDGVVDALIAVFPDGDASSGDSDNIWAHMSTIDYFVPGGFVTDDASANGGFITVDNYSLQGAEQGDGTWDVIDPIGVFAHEFGHLLGLPDQYDYDYDTWGVGTWCLMGFGSWGALWSTDTEHKPTHPCAWCKYQMGWLIPTVVNGTETVQIPPVESNAVAYLLWDNAYKDGRFFLLENRTKTGFDADLLGEGIAIWHCNEDVSWSNDINDLRSVDLEEADGDDWLDTAPEEGGTGHDAGDLYPGTSNNTSFNDDTYPSARDADNNPTGVSAENFAYTAGPGSDVSVTLTQRYLYGFCTAHQHSTYMRRWETGISGMHHGAVRFTSPGDGLLTKIKVGSVSNTQPYCDVKVYDDIVGGLPQVLRTTAFERLADMPVNFLHTIDLDSPLVVTTGQTFLIDVGIGPGTATVPYTLAWGTSMPFSGESFYSDDGTSYTQWTDKDVLIHAIIQNNCVDTDSDGFGNPEFISFTCGADNCPNTYNPGQTDTDENGVGDLCCCNSTRGNANSDPEDKTNIADVTYLVDYLFGIPNGPQPGCPFEGNINADPEEKTNIADVTFLTAYLFGVPSGPPPPGCP